MAFITFMYKNMERKNIRCFFVVFSLIRDDRFDRFSRMHIVDRFMQLFKRISFDQFVERKFPSFEIGNQLRDEQFRNRIVFHDAHDRPVQIP